MNNALCNMVSFKPARLTCFGLCYDIEGNTVDCGGSDAIGYSAGVNPSDIGAGLNLSSNNGNPVAQQAAANSTPSWLNNVLNLATTTINKFVPGQGTQSNLRLQVNPATGQYQYFNPSTGTYVGGPVNTSTSMFGSGNGFLLAALAIIVGLLIFKPFSK